MSNREICIALKKYMNSDEYRHLEALRGGFRDFHRENREGAISAAARGQEVYRNGNGFRLKRHLHQRRLLSTAGDWAAKKLKKKLKSCDGRSFEKILQITREIWADAKDCDFLASNGETYRRGGQIGELWAYDVALRVSFALGLAIPRNIIFVQRGSKQGAHALGFEISVHCWGHSFIHGDGIPSCLRQLPVEHIENFLCLYKRYSGRSATRAKADLWKSRSGLC